MKIESQLLEDHQTKLTVEIEDELLEGAKRRAARKLARRVKIPGFRPGKAPYPVVLRQVGEAAILEEALDLLIDETYPKIIEEASIQPYGPGTLDNVVSTEPLILEFTVPLQAEVELGDYRSQRQPYEPEDVTDEEVNAVLDDLRERQAIVEPVERPVQEGDLVTIRLSATRIQAEEDQDPVLISERSMPILVKPSSDEDEVEWPFSGFARHLIDLSAKDEKTLSHTYSEDAEQEGFRGAEVEFNLVVENVRSRTLPDLDDEFASSIGDYANMEELRAEIRSSLEDRARETYNENYDEEILKEAIGQATIKYPPQMLEQETKDVINDLERRLARQNLDIDLYLKTRQLDMDGLREEVTPVAEARLKRSLLLFELAEAENIQVDQEELQAETMSAVNYLTQTLSSKEARKLNDQAVVGNLARNVMVDMIIQRSLERFRDICSGKFEAMEQEQPSESTQDVDEIDKESTEAVDQEKEAVDIQDNIVDEVAQGGEASTVTDLGTPPIEATSGDVTIPDPSPEVEESSQTD